MTLACHTALTNSVYLLTRRATLDTVPAPLGFFCALNYARSLPAWSDACPQIDYRFPEHEEQILAS